MMCTKQVSSGLPKESTCDTEPNFRPVLLFYLLLSVALYPSHLAWFLQYRRVSATNICGRFMDISLGVCSTAQLGLACDTGLLGDKHQFSCFVFAILGDRHDFLTFILCFAADYQFHNIRHEVSVRSLTFYGTSLNCFVEFPVSVRVQKFLFLLRDECVMHVCFEMY